MIRLSSFILLLCLLTNFVQAQNFSILNLSANDFPFGVGMPAIAETSVKPSTNDTTLTTYATSSGITYALSVSKVNSKDIAAKSISGIVTRLEQKAQNVAQKKSSKLLNQSSTYLDYTNEKGSFISIQVLSIDRYIVQIYTINKSGFLNDNQNNLFFNTLYFGNSTNNTTTISNTISNTTSNTTTSNTTTNNSEWKVNDRAEIFDTKENKWFGCIIIKVNTDGTYRIAYDGYAETYDEDVTADKLHKPTSNTTPTNVLYIKAKKGETIYVKGNLRNGQIMEDLEWAELSSMACWPGIRNVEFEGNHLGYWFDFPKKSIVKITVTPTSTKSRINIYGYSGFDLKKTPPEVSRCTSCEASHPTWIGTPNLQEPATPQTIEFNTTTRHTFVYFAVAGARNIVEGDYTITISLQ